MHSGYIMLPPNLLPNPATLGDTSRSNFPELRHHPWHPGFGWHSSVELAARCINYWHEDYDLRVEATVEAIQRTERNLKAEITDQGMVLPTPTAKVLHRAHKLMFAEKEWAGTYRTVDVVVGDHRPPSHDELRGWMWKLTNRTNGIDTLDDLMLWYHDFETIHPYQDGNGRVGGVVVAAYSHIMYRAKGWLSALQ